jgi:hypothetical protein
MTADRTPLKHVPTLAEVAVGVVLASTDAATTSHADM